MCVCEREGRTVSRVARPVPSAACRQLLDFAAAIPPDAAVLPYIRLSAAATAAAAVVVMHARPVERVRPRGIWRRPRMRNAGRGRR